MQTFNCYLCLLLGRGAGAINNSIIVHLVLTPVIVLQLVGV